MSEIDALHLEKILNCIYKEALSNGVTPEITEKIIVALRLEMEGFI